MYLCMYVVHMCYVMCPGDSVLVVRRVPPTHRSIHYMTIIVIIGILCHWILIACLVVLVYPGQQAGP